MLKLPKSTQALGYESKPQQYFAGARVEFVEALPNLPDASILEIGCGSGGTGRLAIARGKCARYCGVELDERAAIEATKHLHQVVHGNVEAIELPWPHSFFDGLILSEVLEHLVDPWSTLRRLKSLLKPSSIVLAGFPKVAHHRVIRMLMRGEWTLAESGVMDYTHLRWFTPKTYRRLFEDTGYEVLAIEGIGLDGPKTRIASKLLFGCCDWLWVKQMKIVARPASAVHATCPRIQ